MIEVTVESVRINLQTQQRVIILKEVRRNRYLFIWIAQPEAYAIAVELQGIQSQVPLTHDLLKNVIYTLGAKVESVVIWDVQEDLFRGRLVLESAGQRVEINARPSDAIALAVRVKAPIFVEESVMQRAGTIQNADEEIPPGSQEPQP